MADSAKKQFERIMKKYYKNQQKNSYMTPPESVAYHSSAMTNVSSEPLAPSSNSRNEFLEQKKQQSIYSGQQNVHLEMFEKGTISALVDCFQASRKQKAKVQKLERENKRDHETIEVYFSALTKSNKKIADLKERLNKSEKQFKKASRKVDDMEKIIILLSKHLDVCDKKESLSDLVADWRHFNRKREY